MVNMLFSNEIDAIVEGILFISDEMLSIDDLAELIQKDSRAISESLGRLAALYPEGQHGFWLRNLGNRYQFVSSEFMQPYLEKLYKPKFQKLSKAALEVCSIVAYHEPITKGQIEKIRGVSSDGPIRQLQDKNLITEAGRKETPGRPILYKTTENFLSVFGLSHLDDLPQKEEAASLKAFLDKEDEIEDAEVDTNTSVFEEEIRCVE